MYKIALLGKANSGKNAAAKIFDAEIYHYLKANNNPFNGTEFMAFADPVKEIARIMFPGLPRKFFYGASKFRSEIIPNLYKDGNPLTVRDILLEIGTNGRKLDSNVWVNALDANLLKVKNKSLVIITDLRFINEYEYLKSRGFTLIKVFRDDSSNIDHQSETEQDQLLDNQFNFIIDNNGNLTNLKNMIKNIITQI